MNLKLRLSFGREGKDVFADLEALESNFNDYYTTLALRLIEDRVA